MFRWRSHPELLYGDLRRGSGGLAQDTKLRPARAEETLVDLVVPPRRGKSGRSGLISISSRSIRPIHQKKPTIVSCRETLSSQLFAPTPEDVGAGGLISGLISHLSSSCLGVAFPEVRPTRTYCCAAPPCASQVSGRLTECAFHCPLPKRYRLPCRPEQAIISVWSVALSGDIPCVVFSCLSSR